MLLYRYFSSEYQGVHIQNLIWASGDRQKNQQQKNKNKGGMCPHTEIKAPKHF